MITGFKEQTRELDYFEKHECVPVLVEVLKARTKNSPITAAAITDGFKSHFTQKYGTGSRPVVGGARVRKLINYIRRNGLVWFVAANSKGYYVTKDKTELKRYADSLTERIEAQQVILDQVNHAIRQL